VKELSFIPCVLAVLILASEFTRSALYAAVLPRATEIQHRRISSREYLIVAVFASNTFGKQLVHLRHYNQPWLVAFRRPRLKLDAATVEVSLPGPHAQEFTPAKGECVHCR
jgi:hypothetical protein